MAWLDYCEHCGTTEQPRRKVIINATLDGIDDGESDDRELNTKVTDGWVCSICGRKVEVKND